MKDNGEEKEGTGGGPLASTSKSRSVSQVFVESSVLQRFLPSYLSRHLTEALRRSGVDMVTERLVTGVRRTEMAEDEGDESVTVSLLGWDKEKMETDYVILASTHINPSTRIARSSGLEIDTNNGGIVVNSALSAYEGLYVAGNLASYFDPAIGRRRVDAYDHAVNSGIHAGINMSNALGTQQLYTHQPMFRSFLPGVGSTGEGILMQGLGVVDSSLNTVGVWLSNREGKNLGGGGGGAGGGGAGGVDGEGEGGGGGGGGGDEFTRGVVYYLRGNKVVGILLWNASDHLEKAREVLRSQRQGKLPMNTSPSPFSLSPFSRSPLSPSSLSLSSLSLSSLSLLSLSLSLSLSPLSLSLSILFSLLSSLTHPPTNFLST